MFLEANGGWLVPWLERLDHHVKKFELDAAWLKMLPSEYFRRQCWISFDPDETMLGFTVNGVVWRGSHHLGRLNDPYPLR